MSAAGFRKEQMNGDLEGSGGGGGLAPSFRSQPPPPPPPAGREGKVPNKRMSARRQAMRNAGRTDLSRIIAKRNEVEQKQEED